MSSEKTRVIFADAGSLGVAFQLLQPLTAEQKAELFTTVAAWATENAVEYNRNLSSLPKNIRISVSTKPSNQNWLAQIRDLADQVAQKIPLDYALVVVDKNLQIGWEIPSPLTTA